MFTNWFGIFFFDLMPILMGLLRITERVLAFGWDLISNTFVFRKNEKIFETKSKHPLKMGGECRTRLSSL